MLGFAPTTNPVGGTFFNSSCPSVPYSRMKIPYEDERGGVDSYRPFSYCINQAGLGAFTAKSGRKHYNPPPSS